MKSFLRVGLILFLSAEYYFCASEKYENTSSRVINRRMIGGKLAEKGEYPFLVAIFEKDIFEGAFTLISTQTLIGAAHIVDNYGIKDYYGRIGDVNKNKGKKVLFLRRFIHPTYKLKEPHYDIALLILALPITKIPPISLVRRDLTFNRGPAMLVGWGKIGFKEDDDTDLLRVAKVKLMNPKYMAHRFGLNLSDHEITTLSATAKAMKGDSGSPLIIRDVLNRPMLIGILARGGNNIREPDIYMSTSYFHDFIKLLSVGSLKYIDV